MVNIFHSHVSVCVCLLKSRCYLLLSVPSLQRFGPNCGPGLRASGLVTEIVTAALVNNMDNTIFFFCVCVLMCVHD